MPNKVTSRWTVAAGIALAMAVLAGPAAAQEPQSPDSVAHWAQRTITARQTLPVGGPIITADAAERRWEARQRLPGRVQLQLLDVRGRQTSLAGQTMFFSNTLQDPADGTPAGRFVSTCAAVVGTQHRCVGTLVLPDGTLELSANVDFATEEPINAGIVSGTGRFEPLRGLATVTPTDTAGVSTLALDLVPMG